MSRATKVCSDPECPNLQPCPDHQQRPWSGKQGRGKRMRSGSKEQRINRGVMEMHEGRCHVCHLLGSDEVDHVIPLALGGSDGVENRRPIHSEPCHREKTAAEAARARNG